MIVSIKTSPMDNRSYLVFDDETRRGVIVDPSMEVGALAMRMKKERMEPVAILLTHGHFDHICGIPLLLMGRDLPIWIHEDDAGMLTEDDLCGASRWGMEWEPIEPAKRLRDGEVITIDGLKMTMIHTPGHSPGGLSVDINDGEAVLTGDVLFNRGVGRTDIPGADQTKLVKSLKCLMDLHDDAPAYPGHGEATTLAAEREGNPFVVRWLRQ